ncbi:5'/3'-nucleotidase SurE [Sinobacterium norvegicum]|uniref:5'-nucleotidase n=1 Tax=Sinobacterium norvegicum TaxID=1641715 RepID=A0ABN8EFS1_9GAMM|nr:5'/3'-nucleotidase SurE [Sinobacterium norvegicum]CAH0991198.1 5'/3'-nucleotidase SurE [Sinobacterium norvegicum]
MNKLTLPLGSALLALSAPALSLNLLLVNDDSCNSEGINTMADVLEARGHAITMVAPAGEQSGKSSSISTEVGQSYDISNSGFEGPTSAANRYCVRVPTENPEEGGAEGFITASASPRDSALVGLQLMSDNQPDMIISGINKGQNVGRVAVTSGTIGAVVAGLQNGIPSIAISRHRFTDEDGVSIEGAAAIVADVIAELEANQIEGQPLLPAMTGISINTPKGVPVGIASTTLGVDADLRFGPKLNESGGVDIGFGGFANLAEYIGEEAATTLASNPNATIADYAAAGLNTNDESQMYVANFVTITTLDGDYTAGLRKRELLQVKLRNLSL